MTGLAVVVLIVGVLVLWGWVYWYRSERLLKKYDAQVHFSVGKYLLGLEGVDRATDDVECVVGRHDFVFAKMSGGQLGRVPRGAVEEVAIDDKSQITQRLTATRLVALGVLALAFPKKTETKEWCVGIRWVDGKGLRRATVFEFTESNAERDANEAASKLIKYVQRPAQHVGGRSPEENRASASSDSKVCPYCAETIKAAAIVCRFCNRELPKQP